MTEDNKEVAVAYELKRVENSLEAARTLFKANLHADSVSRSYYAVFHAACAVLLTKGLEAKSHNGVKTLFNLHFVQPALVHRKYSLLLSKMQKFREEADYNPKIVFTEMDAEESLNEAESFCREMKNFIQNEGYGG